MADPIKLDVASVKSMSLSGFSTKDIMLSLSRPMLGVPNMPDNPALSRGTAVYMGFGQISEKLKLDSITNAQTRVYDEAPIRATVRNVLEMLKNTKAPSAKASYEPLNRDAGPALERSEALEQTTQLLRQKSKEDLDQSLESVKSALKLVDEAKDPVEKADSQEVRNLISMAEKNRQSVKLELEKLEKAHLVSKSELLKIAKTGASNLSLEERASVSLDFQTPTPF